MFKDTEAFSGFSVKDIDQAADFYGVTLGLAVAKGPMGLELKIAGSNSIFVYPKDDHTPATYTVLNFRVKDVDKAVDELKSKDIKCEQYKGMTDAKGIARGIANHRGPDIAWFKDPAGNILAVLQEA